MGHPAVSMSLSASERRNLESLARAEKTGHARARRARILRAAASGMDNKTIGLEVGAEANTVGKWRRRFAAHRVDGLLDAPRPGTPRKIGDEVIAETRRRTLENAPAGRCRARPLDAGERARWQHALFAAYDGSCGGLRTVDHPPHLARLRVEAASQRNLHAL